MRVRFLVMVCAVALVASSATADAQSDQSPTCRPATASAAASPVAARPALREPASVVALAAANGAARRSPEAEGFAAARHVYTYAPGALYELYANPNFVSSILLEPGEALNDVAAGDTSRWMVTEATAETERDGRTIVLVKPQATGLRTNIVLITDRRTYIVEATSHAHDAYSAEIAWCYADPAPAAPAAHAVDRLYFGYRVRTVRGRTPTWVPTRVFDDGRRTWIELPAHVAATDMPPLFVITPEGAELANYRVQGTRYMIDRVFDVAELRLGTRAPIIVRIERGPQPRRVRARPLGSLP